MHLNYFGPCIDCHSLGLDKQFERVSVVFQIERRMEVVRVVSHNTHKRMVTCLQGHVGADAEKRHVGLIGLDWICNRLLCLFVIRSSLCYHEYDFLMLLCISFFF